jgi:hypothetical protein
MAAEVKQTPTQFKPDNNELLKLIFDMLPKEPDTQLHVRDTEIGVHKTLLSAHSTVFRTVFDGKFEHKRYDLDFDPVVFQKFIDILYFKPVILTPDEELEIIQFLDYYDIRALQEKMESDFCAKKLTPENVYRAYKCVKLEKNKLKCKEALEEYLCDLDITTIEKKIDSVDDMYMFLKEIWNKGRHQATIRSIREWFKIHKCQDGYTKLLTVIDPKELSISNLVEVGDLEMFDHSLLFKLLSSKISKGIKASTRYEDENWGHERFIKKVVVEYEKDLEETTISYGDDDDFYNGNDRRIYVPSGREVHIIYDD